MGGTDTYRGIGFQTACAISSAVDVLLDRDLVAIVVEGTDEISDYEIVNVQGDLERVVQVKSRAEPRIWTPSEIARVVRRWQAIDKPSNKSYEFVSDAQLGGAATRLVDAMRRVADQTPQEKDAVILRRYGLAGGSSGFFSKVSVRSRVGDVRTVLAGASLKLARLYLGSGARGEDEIDQCVDRLFRAVHLAGGDENIERRTFDRQALAELAVIDLAALDTTSPWTLEIRQECIASVLDAAIPTQADLLGLGTAPTSEIEGLGVRRRLRDLRTGKTTTVGAVAKGSEGFSIAAPMGSGKTISLSVISKAAAREGIVPIQLAPDYYAKGTLEQRLHTALERLTDRRLSPGTVSKWANLGGLVLLDGATERPRRELNELFADLRRLRETYPRLRIGVSGRESLALANVEFPVYRLEAFDTRERVELASLFVDSPVESHRLCGEIESRTGIREAPPLIFLMALAGSIRGDAATTGAGLYEKCLRELRLQQGGVANLELLAEVLTLASAKLFGATQRSAPRRWWLEAFHQIMESVREEKRFEVSGTSTEAVLDEARGTGLLVSNPEGLLEFPHDSFLDYFAGQALQRGVLIMPELIDERWEAALRFRAEAYGLPAADVNHVAASNLVAFADLGRVSCPDETSIEYSSLASVVQLIVSSHFSGPALNELGLSRVGVVAVETSDRIVIALDSSGDVIDMDSLGQVGDAFKEALFVFDFPRHSGALETAMLVWWQLFERMLPRSETSPALAPRDSEGLVAAVGAAFRQQAAELRRVASIAAPTLADRVAAAIGWTGIDASISPGQPTSWRTEHDMEYRIGGTEVRVVYEDREDRAKFPGDGFSMGRTSAEHFVETDPTGEASRAVASYVERLLMRAPF